MATTSLSTNNPLLASAKGGEKMFVIEHCQGGFLPHLLTSMFLKEDGAVIIVGLVNDRAHYQNVARKLGVDLQLAENEGRFRYLDLVSAPFEGYPSISSLTSKQTSSSSPFISLSPLQTQSLIDLLSAIHNTVAEIESNKSEEGEEEERGRREGNRPLLVIVDSLLPLLATQERADVLDFVRYVNLLAEKQTISVLCQIPWIEKFADLTRAMEGEASIAAEIQNLKTGYSREVHGQVTVAKSGPWSRGVRHGKLFHYRLREAGAMFFEPGHAPML